MTTYKRGFWVGWSFLAVLISWGNAITGDADGWMFYRLGVGAVFALLALYLHTTLPEEKE